MSASSRRVVTGVLDTGKEGFIEDRDSPIRLSTAMSTIVDLWSVDHLPAPMQQKEAVVGEVVLDPPSNGVVVRISHLYPDKQWADSDMNEVFGALNAIDAHDGSADEVALHTTETVDIATVISGEVWAVLESGETLLKQGESLVQRGTKHAWSNRTDETAVILFVMMSANRES